MLKIKSISRSWRSIHAMRTLTKTMSNWCFPPVLSLRETVGELTALKSPLLWRQNHESFINIRVRLGSHSVSIVLQFALLHRDVTDQVSSIQIFASICNKITWFVVCESTAKRAVIRFWYCRLVCGYCCSNRLKLGQFYVSTSDWHV